jgi:D-alanyl-lipoteichoic acid acyltransferase DltB (MBOAT superfamily)
MLFNSFAFLFFYLPVVLAGYFVLGRRQALWAGWWLALASLFFYGYWSAVHLPLLMLSICFNYVCGRQLAGQAAQALPLRRKAWLIASVGANLALLGWYKYANFIVVSIHELNGSVWRGWDILLPIGISFFTFTQIAFLVDCYRGQLREYRFGHYLLFVSYFPHLVAGPILHHREMMPQFADPANSRLQPANVAIGLSIFVIGLAKKVLIADNIAPLVNPVFAAGAHPPLLEAWTGTLAYAFQLYFDFSGYCDMAIGLSRLFGVKLPLNFNSPYKAANISEFWRRWHMTLSRFLRDYLYIPLGGNRHGRFARGRNLMLTMLLGGLWHGAGWTFLVWGGLHGLYLALHQAWWHRQHQGGTSGAVRTDGSAWQRSGGVALTFMAVTVAWVFFRAPDLASAVDILGALVGGNGIDLPRGCSSTAAWWHMIGLAPHFEGVRWIEFGGLGLPALAVAMLLAFFAPNTQEIFAHHAPCIERLFHGNHRSKLMWSPRPAWGVALGALFIACIFGMNKVTEFLYFQF